MTTYASTKGADSVETIPSEIIREDCITLISEDDGGVLPAGHPITVSRFAINGMNVLEIRPMNMLRGYADSLAILDLMTWCSEQMDTRSTRLTIDGKCTNITNPS